MMKDEFIPLSVPTLQGKEWEYVKECLDTNWVSSVGSYVTRFEQDIQSFTKASHAIATMNGTSALHVSLRLLGVQAGNLVIVPNITFVASANAVSYLGAEPLFMDVDADSWQMNLDLLFDFLLTETIQTDKGCIHRKSGKKIGAIMIVHVLGNMCAMDELLSIADRFQIPVLEDSTEALGSTFHGKFAGTFAPLGTLSFNGNKLITTGGGGMILTDDPELARRAKHLTTTAKADAVEYLHDEIGYNYRLVNVLAAIGVAQMNQLQDFLAAHKQMAERYKMGLEKIEGVVFQKVLPAVQPNNWLFTAKFPRQRELLAYLNEHHIQARPFWIPMNQLPMYQACIYIHQKDTSQEVYQSCLSLPSSSSLTEAQQNRILDVIHSFYAQ
ncbi:MAG: LegC family aminotransferase [Spirosomataceae bacterium]